VQVVVGRDAEERQHLVEHLAVLRGDADAGLETVGVLPDLVDDRAILMASGRVPKTMRSFMCTPQG